MGCFVSFIVQNSYAKQKYIVALKPKMFHTLFSSVARPQQQNG